MRKSPNAGRRRRVIPALSILGFLALLLTACAGGGSPGGSKGSATSANLTWWGWSKLISSAVISDEPRLATVSPDLQLAIGSATTTVASGSATPAKAAATLQAAAAKLPNHGAVG